jgi:uncharacterized membrane protein YkvA (DUF1232 family)
MKLAEKAKAVARRFQEEVAFYRLVWKHPGTPRAARWLLGAALAYAASPIDLIPDFIPGIGLLDDLIILPLLVGFAVCLIPRAVIEECRRQSRATGEGGVSCQVTGPTV